MPELSSLIANGEALGLVAGTADGIPVPDPDDFATAAQGALADTAVQPADIAAMETSVADHETRIDTLEGTVADDQTAAEVTIADAGSHFTSTDVEGALQELATGGVVGAVTVVEVSPSEDTYINQQVAGTTHGSATELWMGESLASSSFGRAALLAFDLSGLSGATPFRSVLSLTRTSVTTAALSTTNTLMCRRVRRAFVASQATWTNWATGSAWTTPGARSTATDVYPETYPVATLRGDYLGPWQIDLTAVVRDAVAAGDTTLRILLQWAAATDGQNAAVMASVDSATAADHPKLRMWR